MSALVTQLRNVAILALRAQNLHGKIMELAVADIDVAARRVGDHQISGHTAYRLEAYLAASEQASSPNAPAFASRQENEALQALTFANVEAILKSFDEDSHLLERALAIGDRGAFNSVHARHDKRIRRLIYRFTNDWFAIDDISQEVWIKVLNGFQDFRGASTFGTWIYRIALNKAIEYHQRTRLRATSEFSEDALKHAGLALEISVDPPDVDLRLREAIDDLPFLQRAAFLLIELEDFKPAAVAEMLGFPSATIHQALKRAKNNLRRTVVHRYPCTPKTARKELVMRAHLRFYCKDAPGILFRIARVMEEQNIRIVRCKGDSLLGHATIIAIVAGLPDRLDKLRNDLEKGFSAMAAIANDPEAMNLTPKTYGIRTRTGIEMSVTFDQEGEPNDEELVAPFPYHLFVRSPDFVGCLRRICEFLYGQSIDLIEYDGATYRPRRSITDQLASKHRFTLRVPRDFDPTLFRSQFQNFADENEILDFEIKGG